jgi:uncharacterized protein YwqG
MVSRIDNPLTGTYDRRMNNFTQELWSDFKQALAEYPELIALGLEQSARLSIRLATTRTSMDEIKIGQSRIGGIPDMPLGMEWPRWRYDEKDRRETMGESGISDFNRPLGYIAQINLNVHSVVNSELPRSGWLYFFYYRYVELPGYDPLHKGCCRVLYADCDQADLIRTAPPDDADPEHTGHACRLEASVEMTLPDIRDFDFEYESPIFNTYLKASCELTDNDTFVHHRVLGYPDTIQNPMELECQLVTNGLYCGNSSGYEDERATALKLGAADWRLLLQIDTDEDGPGWKWYDDGRIYIWIRKQDLKVCRFDDAWLIVQCT